MTVSALVAQYGYAFVQQDADQAEFAGRSGEARIRPTSIDMPTAMKKSPSSRPLKGSMHRGMLELDRVIAVAFVAGTLGDQFYFYLGRRHGQRLLARWPALQARAQRVRPLLERHPNAAIFSLRFLYGLRTAGPIALGMLGVSARRFTLLNLLSAALWSLAFCLLGYQFGQVLQRLLPRLHAVEEAVLVGVLIAALGWTVWRRRRARHRLRA